MPHINLMFPFIHPDYFHNVYQKLSEKIQEVEEFEIQFNTLSYFPNKYVWAKPEVQGDEQAIHKLYQKVLEVVPN